ncbi:hypothetical protein ABZP36_029979 [Zizania latifolia]
MGSSMSHVAHPHNLHREVCKLGNATCGMCTRPVAVSERVYRCDRTECKNFLLHEACFRLPKNTKLVCVGRLQLITNNTNAGVLFRGNDRCKICANSMAGVSCVYKSAVDDNFRVHPRCGVLPPRVSTSDEHPLGLSKPTESNNRRCVGEKHLGTGGGGRGQPQAWSYKCSVDKTACQGVELCVECALGNKPGFQCCCCCDLNTCSFVAYCVGRVVQAFTLGCIGLKPPA